MYPCQPPHPYAVLGYFHITDLWKEKQIPTDLTPEGVTTWRIRFEKADLKEPSWWATKGDHPSEQTGTACNTPKTPTTICGKCTKPSKSIYTTEWFCLNHECDHYFMFPNGVAVDPKDLAYTDTFINERTPFVGEIPSIRPEVPDPSGMHGTELALRRGFVCPDCGCCNRRVFWSRWVCENVDCQYDLDALMLPYPAAMLEEENSTFDGRMATKRVTNGINLNSVAQAVYPFDPFATIYHRGYLQFSQTLTLGGYGVRQYFLADSGGQILGSFTIFSASEKVKCQPNGPWDLFRELERTDLGLRRNAAAVQGRKWPSIKKYGTVLTNGCRQARRVHTAFPAKLCKFPARYANASADRPRAPGTSLAWRSSPRALMRRPT